MGSQDAANNTDPLANYQFPSERLSRVLRDPSKTPIVLVACGSFSPLTYLHLRIFEMASDYVRQNTEFEVMGGYLSPVSDKYKKPGLLSAHHRYALHFLSSRSARAHQLCYKVDNVSDCCGRITMAYGRSLGSMSRLQTDGVSARPF